MACPRSPSNRPPTALRPRAVAHATPHALGAAAGGGSLAGGGVKLEAETHSEAAAGGGEGLWRGRAKSSQYKGVCWHKQSGLWRAQIHCAGEVK